MGAWEAVGRWGFPGLEQAAPLRCSGGGSDGNHGHLFLLSCGGNRSSDLPGAHMQQVTSHPGEGRDQIPGSQEEESFLIYIGKLTKASQEFQLFNPRGLNPGKINKVAWGNV